MYAVIRIRGRVGIRREVEDTLKMLRLKTVNSCVVVPETDSYKGMLKKAYDFITYGEINFDTFLKMIKKRGRVEGDKKLTEEIVKEVGFNSVEEMARAIFDGKIRMKDVRLNPVFRLTPPSKGFKSTKEHYPKGDLGYRGSEINELIERMI